MRDDAHAASVAAAVSVRELRLSFGALDVLRDLDLDIAEGEFLVLLGPSGCGKSTLLNCIAGLLEPTDGQVWIKGRNVTWEEPSRRGVGMVFQSYALYPQMTVRGNLSFGLRNQRMPRARIAERVERAARILQIEPLLDRKPATLSGGQRQRVAIGRALVREADVFLFDEPLSNLDAKLRAELRVELKRLHADLANTMIYVTHDQIEALTLADRIAVLRSGVIQQLGPPQEIYNRPANLFVAGFIGSPAMSMVEGRVEGGRFHAGAQSVPLEGYDGRVPGTMGRAILGLRPEHVEIAEADGGIDGGLRATVDIDEPMGADALLWLDLEGQRVSVRVPVEWARPRGAAVVLRPDMAKASVFDPESEARL